MTNKTRPNRCSVFGDQHVRVSGPVLLRLSMLALLLPMLINGCNSVDDAIKLVRDSVSKSIDALDRNSNSWKSVVTNLSDEVSKLADKLPAERRAIKADLQDVASQAIGTAGSEVKCDVDFMGIRVKEQLKQVLAKFMGTPVEPLVPRVCLASPVVLSMDLSPADRNRVVFSGFNFDTSLRPTLRLVGSNGNLDVSSALSQTSPYQLVANVASNGVLLDSGSIRLVLEWQGRVLGEIAVLQPSMPLCAEEDKTVTTADTILTYLPPLTNGDAEFGNNGPVVRVEVSLEVNDQTLNIAKTMSAVETTTDWTTIQGTDRTPVYTAPTGWRIASVVGPTSSYWNFTADTTDKPYPQELGPGGVVRQFTVTADTNGPDVGRTGFRALLNPIKVHLVQIAGCITQAAIDEAVRRKQLSQERVFYVKSLRRIDVGTYRELVKR